MSEAKFFGEAWIRSLPTAVDELQTALFDKRTRVSSAGLRLLFPPASKEADLNIHETTVGIFQKLGDDSVDDVVHLIEDILVDGDL